MTTNFHIRGGKLLDGKSIITENTDLWIIDGKITFQSPSKTKRDLALHEISAHNKFVLPGLVDMRCHIGSTAAENVRMISRSAARGGYTTLLAMPDFTVMADDPGAVSLIRDSASKHSDVKIYATGCITENAEGKRLAPLGSLKEAGIVGVTDCPNSPQNCEIFAKGIEYAKMFDLPVIELPRENSLSRDGAAHDGSVALKMGLKPFPRAAEEIFVQRAITLSKHINASIHLTSLSSRGSVELVRIAKQNEVKISADVTPHHLLLTEESILGYDTNAKTSPPLRQEEDRIALIEGLRDGTIDAICSSHQPIPNHEKNIEFDLSPAGVLGLSTALSSVYKALSNYCDEKETLNVITGTMSTAPSNIMGLGKGGIEEGKKADLTIYDPQKNWIYTPSEDCSEIINSPFEGKTITGRVETTFANGKLIHTI